MDQRHLDRRFVKLMVTVVWFVNPDAGVYVVVQPEAEHVVVLNVPPPLTIDQVPFDALVKLDVKITELLLHVVELPVIVAVGTLVQ